MAHLIDKDALVAEIERLRNDFPKVISQKEKDCQWLYWRGLNRIRDFINSLEVKEVDLDKSLTGFIGRYAYENGGEYPSAIEIAKHFFDIGMRVSNPITAADRGTAEEIIINLKRVEKDYRINLTKEITWVRNKVQKGE